MAKRAAPDEKPYRPLLDAELVNAVISNMNPTPARASSPPPAAAPSARIFEMPRAEPPRRHEFVGDAEEEFDEPRSLASDAERSRQSVQVVVEKFDQEKRILFTRPESQAIDRLVVSLATRLNAQVKVSHVVRALVGLMLHAESEIDKRAGETGPLVRPANGDAQGLQRFEREIGRIFAAALRDAGPIR